MLKNFPLLLLTLIFITQFPVIIPSYSNNQLNKRSSDSPIFEAKLFLNKLKILKKLILKRDSLTFEITLEKIKNFEKFYGELTNDSKINLLQLIKKEYKLEKNKLKHLPREDRFSLTKKSTYAISALALEVYLLRNLSTLPSINTMRAYDALCTHFKGIAAIINIPIILMLNAWAFFDYSKYNSKINLMKLTRMKSAIKSLL